MCEKILRINRMKYMLFASWEVWIGENCARGIEVSIVSKFQFFILKLWELARFFAAMTCVNLVFPPQKIRMGLFLIEFLQFLLCNLR